MSQICNFFPLNFISFQDVKTYTFTVAGVGVCRKKAVINSAVMPEVDKETGYSDNPEHNCQSFLCRYL